MAVTFDAATSAIEESGDGVLSLTHTATGSNLAAFASGTGYGAGSGPTSTSMTYNAVSMGTALWDLHTASASNLFNSGYMMVNPPTGAQSVVHTTSAAPSNHFLSVITVSDVDVAGTPIGTVVTLGPQSTSPWSVTVGSIGANDLVVDSMVGNGTNSLTVGANQTQRTNRNNAGVTVWMGGSTQAGADGGVMSWTMPTPIDGFLGAFAFKPVAAGGGMVIPVLTRQFRQRLS